ncbi:hypothetical protein NP233_g4363 [Leucocoprinus birnbaumii]|uniref:Rho-GAP domain-containing protein n=1 Tax=Leucocoprinus birnbaumii TaxID=56174 RepID=A0AAD5YSW5_9AGAR|nr:hypothetical protein NP233_g4363 [Leucocoprinus birnbaumii]
MAKTSNWKQETYTTHDVASVFRRYLTQMPEPVIPHSLYHKFRDALANAPHSQDAVIAEYKALIRQMSQAHQYLLLYVLDLLSVFARKSDKNLMTAQNLAVIFRPGILSHPSHEMLPAEHALSQQVLEFLIANQDWFMLDTPAPNPSLLSPSTQAPTPHPAGAPLHHPPPPSAYIHHHNGASTAASAGIGIHWRGVASEGGGAGTDDERGWKSAGVPMMTEKEIQREQERIKMMRRRTTLERGVFGTLEEPDMNGDSPTATTAPPSAYNNNPILSSEPASVTRSRTLPSSRSRREAAATAAGSNPNVNDTTDTHVTVVDNKKEEKERSRLTKKSKRASMVTPSTTQVTSSNGRRTSQLLGGSSA